MDSYNTLSWELPSYADSNRTDWPVEIDGEDGIFELTDVGQPTKSPFQKRDSKTKEPLWMKDSSGEYILDADGNRVGDFTIQTQLTWTCAEMQADPSMVGQSMKQFYTFSMNADSQLYKVVKAINGGAVDPSWKPKPSDLLNGYVKATIEFGEPKGQSGKRWPKLANPRPARGFSRPVDTNGPAPF